MRDLVARELGFGRPESLASEPLNRKRFGLHDIGNVGTGREREVQLGRTYGQPIRRPNAFALFEANVVHIRSLFAP